jgi:hypothetical protein
MFDNVLAAIVPGSVAIVLAVIGAIKWRAYLAALEKMAKGRENLDIPDAIRAYKSGPLGDLLDALARLFGRRRLCAGSVNRPDIGGPVGIPAVA